MLWWMIGAIVFTVVFAELVLNPKPKKRVVLLVESYDGEKLDLSNPFRAPRFD